MKAIIEGENGNKNVMDMDSEEKSIGNTEETEWSGHYEPSGWEGKKQALIRETLKRIEDEGFSSRQAELFAYELRNTVTKTIEENSKSAPFIYR